MTEGSKLKNSSTKQGKIFFLDYTFNPALRTLQREDTILQLRKKQSDVLALLCAKYPSPVSQDEFLSEVWDGSYVTSQSIAQMIRSLRISLKDESKNIIVTIPKLGYQLTAEPTWEASLSEPELEPDTLNERSPAAGTIELDNISYSAKPITSYQPAPPTTSMTVVSYVPQHKPVGRKLTSRKWFIFAVATLSIFLAGVAMGARGYAQDLFEEKKVFFSGGLLAQYSKTRLMDNYLYCCKTDHGLVCSPRASMLMGKCTLNTEAIKAD
ncbi:TPA: winged helix-turn-helix domain-containing protein [Enterobacter cloacae]|nr:winged helix-turn-helix domain-containing protein [Enterobacter pasteurii]